MSGSTAVAMPSYRELQADSRTIFGTVRGLTTSALHRSSQRLNVVKILDIFASTMNSRPHDLHD